MRGSFLVALCLNLAISQLTCDSFGECPTTGVIIYAAAPNTTQCSGVACTLGECCIALSLGGECATEANCTNNGRCKNITAGMYLDVRGTCGSTNNKPLPNTGTVDDGLNTCLQSPTCVGIEADLNSDVYYLFTVIQGASVPGAGSTCYRKYAADVDYCVCDSGWGGMDCSIVRKSCPQNCLSRGHCNTVTGNCTCYSPYTGNYCQNTPQCPGTPACNGHGVCDQFGVCRCESTHIGADCGIEVSHQGLSQGAFGALVGLPFFAGLFLLVGLCVWSQTGPED